MLHRVLISGVVHEKGGARGVVKSVRGDVVVVCVGLLLWPGGFYKKLKKLQCAPKTSRQKLRYQKRSLAAFIHTVMCCILRPWGLQ